MSRRGFAKREVGGKPLSGIGRSTLIRRGILKKKIKKK